MLLPDLRSASDGSKTPAFRRGRQDEGNSFKTAHASASASLQGRPADHLVAVPRHGARTAYISADRWRMATPPRTTSSTRAPPPSRGRVGGSSGDAQADMPSGQASGATCVQKLDDSRNSAIHTTYRISLRSSSLREPRYPLLRVVCYSSRFASLPPVARAPPGEGKEGSDSLGRTWCAAHPRGENPTRARLRPPANWPAKGPNSRRRPGKRTRRRAPRRGGPRPSEARPRGPLPARTRDPGRTKACSQGLQLCVCNDPSAGSPTETLLRLLLPLNDKV